jgi:hypothetical protein
MFTSSIDASSTSRIAFDDENGLAKRFSFVDPVRLIECEEGEGLALLADWMGERAGLLEVRRSVTRRFEGESASEEEGRRRLTDMADGRSVWVGRSLAV